MNPPSRADRLERVRVFFAWPRGEMRLDELLDQMIARAGGVEAFDSLIPGDFARLAIRTADEGPAPREDDRSPSMTELDGRGDASVRRILAGAARRRASV